MSDMADHLAVLTTVDTMEAAEQLARSAVAARVAACAQIDGPVTSVFRWEGAVTVEQEWRVLLKAPAATYDALEAHILEHHGYDVPEVIAFDVTRGSEGYLRWLDAEAGAATR